MWGPFLGDGVALCEIPDGKPAIEKRGYSTKGWKALITGAGSIHGSVDAPGRAKSYGVTQITDTITSRTFHIERYGF
jgi:hypothetical protein